MRRPARKIAALYHLLLTLVIGGIAVLTLYAGIYYPHTAQPLTDERQKAAVVWGGGADKTGESEDTGSRMAAQADAVSPKTGGSEPWYG